MLPHFNPHFCNPNNQLQLNGANPSAPQQVIGNQGNLGQMRPQFQVGAINNPQLAMPPFTNPNTYFAPNQFFPFPQATFQNPSFNNLPHLLANNSLNPSQFLPNGQLNVPNLVQNINQLLQMQMQIMNCVPQNLGLFLNAQSGGGNNNRVVPQSANGNGLQLMTHNAAVTSDFGPHKAQRTDNILSAGAAQSQNNAGVVNGVNNRQNNWKNSHNTNFTGNHKHDASQRGFGNRQFHNRQNVSGNFKFNNENRGKGNKNIGVKNFNLPNSSEQIPVVKKRSLVVNYTPQEIQQWREQRKKNYPSNANMEKKLKEKPNTDAVSKIRRQQLKEILAKQAELGCEVAEIPSSYLSDLEQQTDGRQQNNKVFGKRGRFHNKFDKKGKFQQNGRFSKRQRSDNSYSANLRKENKMKPSLLKKLLSSEIKKDKKHILQVFRFMVMNSFFENLPEQPLKYPVVIVKELGDESESIDEKFEAMKGDAVSTVSVEADAQDKNADISSRGCDDDNDDDEGERPQPQEDGEIME